MENLEYFNKISTLIRKEYAGEPDLLDSFIEQIELIELCTPDNKKPVMIKLVLSRLVGRAKALVPSDTDDIQKVKDILKAKIKPDMPDAIFKRVVKS